MSSDLSLNLLLIMTTVILLTGCCLETIQTLFICRKTLWCNFIFFKYNFTFISRLDAVCQHFSFNIVGPTMYVMYRM